MSKILIDTCPECGCEARCQHGIKNGWSDRWLHTWDCEICGEIDSIVLDGCKDCEIAALEHKFSTATARAKAAEADAARLAEALRETTRLLTRASSEGLLGWWENGLLEQAKAALAAYDAATGDLKSENEQVHIPPYTEHLVRVEGIICPICKHTISDADYWGGDMCVKCAIEKESKNVTQE